MGELNINRAAELARAAMYPEHVNVDSCIAMSRFMVEVLNHFGWHAEARRAIAVVYNRKMAELINSDRLDLSKPMPKWAEDAGAWNVGIGNGEKGLHVVVLAGAYMIDASLDQASRPEHGIELQPSAFPYDPQMNPLVYQDEGGLVLTYKITDDKTTFKGSPDWHKFRERYGDVAAGAIRQLKKEMK